MNESLVRYLLSKKGVSNTVLLTYLILNVIPSGDIDGVNVDYTTPDEFEEGTLMVYRNGIRLTPGSANDYVETGTNSFRINPSIPLVTGERLLVDYIKKGL